MAKLKWRDSEDVYKPINLTLKEFLQQKQDRITQESYINIRELYEQLKNNKMNVFVEPEAETELIKHLSIDPYNETGGVLVGQAYLCPNTKIYYTEIVGSIAAPYTVGNRVHFQFTPECWQAILKNQKQYFTNTTIVGWYHSHPGHGIFLSGTDLNTQRLCFKQVWQIAIVYDPLRKEIGYFYDAEGRKIDATYLQKSSQFGQSELKQQLSWRKNQQPELPLLPVSYVLDSTISDESQLENNNLQIPQQANPTSQWTNIKWIMIIVFIWLTVLLLILISQPQETMDSQPVESKTVESNQ